ncbi:uncharacterized protein LOC127721204 [Mytilus californianus]|uniref:uncharacterized protein LOC127721204 n=1 Tax=Mytilus californianus TaxID=6549 RepID=UPI0022462C6F|nr:uncharacterized protein LOC127721204 [Mytilus californianus]
MKTTDIVLLCRNVRCSFNESPLEEDNKCGMSQSEENITANENDDGEENDSIWLFEVLDIIGANDYYRKTCQRSYITQEIIKNFLDAPEFSNYIVGGIFEASNTPGIFTDIDAIGCDDSLDVIEDISKAEKNRDSLLIIKEQDTPPGYCKLQFVKRSVPYTIRHFSLIEIDCKRFFQIDRFERIVLTNFAYDSGERFCHFSRPHNKCAAQLGPVFDVKYNDTLAKCDMVWCYRCKQWPTEAQEWLTRRRYNGWPTKSTFDELKPLGYFVVRKGHPCSSEIDLEWRISLTLQERTLVSSLTDVQYKCYVLLKMLNRDIINLECITSYHWKTCLFYVIENNKSDVWKKNLLLHCVKLCIKQMLEWVKHRFCPNYFISRENLFYGRLTKSLRIKSEQILVELLNDGFHCLRYVKSSKICHYVESRESLTSFQRLKEESIKLYRKTVDIMNTQTDTLALNTFSEHLSTENSTELIELLWLLLYRSQTTNTMFAYTKEDTRRSLSLLTPVIYTYLASHISAMSIRQPNRQVRNFLLLGSLTYFTKGDLTGYLKFISVLYTVGCYKDCEFHLHRFRKKNPSIFESPQVFDTTSILFLPTELPIIPDAMKYEIFKYFGISMNLSERYSIIEYGAIVDSNIYYFLLKFLIKGKYRATDSSREDIRDIFKTSILSNVHHPDVAFNLTAWYFYSIGLTPTALSMLYMSWKAMDSLKIYFQTNIKEIKQKIFQCNSAKFHALVFLYNTWFTRNTARTKFCFQCFLLSRKTCSRCKTATYCSKKCQKQNWKIHKHVCEIVKSVHKV